ncbi:hypothetical protein AQJ46_49140 [Streptomyces canus]|uniref:Uncharacterized protein n=1 Tax=Streptomyces canus TaxID=58343 RepID=A0A124HV25_9ACTN|nr:hypothetical protein AQJ46_49140 [Streptomyces canus]
MRTRWSMSRARAAVKEVSSYGEYQLPPVSRQLVSSLGAVTASSRRTWLRVLQPSRSASVQCRNFVRSYPVRDSV